MSVPEPAFFERADAHINLCNEQLKTAPGPAVGASATFGAARFNTWLCAEMYGSKDVMVQMKDQAIAQLIEHYAEQLRENFEVYIRDFDTLVQPGAAAR